jgi:hypothetical protein
MSIHMVHIRHGWVNDRPRLDLIHLIHWIRGFRRFRNRRPGSDMSFCGGRTMGEWWEWVETISWVTCIYIYIYIHTYALYKYSRVCEQISWDDIPLAPNERPSKNFGDQIRSGCPAIWRVFFATKRRHDNRSVSENRELVSIGYPDKIQLIFVDHHLPDQNWHCWLSSIVGRTHIHPCQSISIFHLTYIAFMFFHTHEV